MNAMDIPTFTTFTTLTTLPHHHHHPRPRPAPSLSLAFSLFLLCRIIEIEWAVKNNVPFAPEARRSNTKKGKRGEDASSIDVNQEGGDDPGEPTVDSPADDIAVVPVPKLVFPLSEKTNSPGKRRSDNGLEAETPKKRKQANEESDPDSRSVTSVSSDIPGAPAPTRIAATSV